MNIYIVLIKSPDGDIEIEMAKTEIQAKNIIYEYRRYKTYDGYEFEVCEKYIDIEADFK